MDHGSRERRVRRWIIAASGGLAIWRSGDLVTLTHASIPWPTVGSIDVRRARTDIDGNFVASHAFIVVPWRSARRKSCQMARSLPCKVRVEVHNFSCAVPSMPRGWRLLAAAKAKAMAGCDGAFPIFCRCLNGAV